MYVCFAMCAFKRVCGDGWDDDKKGEIIRKGEEKY